VGDEVSVRVRIVVLMFVALLGSTTVHAQTAALGEVDVTSDADHFDALRLRTGAFLRYESPYRYEGVAVQATEYTQSSWKRAAPAALFLWRNQRRDNLAGTLAEAGLVHVAGRTRVIGDATWSLRPSARTGFEILAAGDLVETRRSLDRATAFTFFGASAERDLTPRFTAIGLAAYQHFTDGNNRPQLRGRLIWLLVPEQGISAQLRARHFTSQQLNVPGEYFNPRRYLQWDAALAIRKRYAGWIWSGTVAAGREQIDGNINRTTGLVDFRGEGNLPRGMHVVLHAAYNRSAGFAISDRYWYRLIGVTFVVPF
jgi:hypothetical protein